jgi:hypothetical protein
MRPGRRVPTREAQPTPGRMEKEDNPQAAISSRVTVN